jgi:hypothetical protein
MARIVDGDGDLFHLARGYAGSSESTQRSAHVIRRDENRSLSA